LRKEIARALQLALLLHAQGTVAASLSASSCLANRLLRVGSKSASSARNKPQHVKQILKEKQLRVSWASEELKSLSISSCLVSSSGNGRAGRVLGRERGGTSKAQRPAGGPPVTGHQRFKVLGSRRSRLESAARQPCTAMRLKGQGVAALKVKAVHAAAPPKPWPNSRLQPKASGLKTPVAAAALGFLWASGGSGAWSGTPTLPAACGPWPGLQEQRRGPGPFAGLQKKTPALSKASSGLPASASSQADTADTIPAAPPPARLPSLSASVAVSWQGDAGGLLWPSQ